MAGRVVAWGSELQPDRDKVASSANANSFFIRLKPNSVAEGRFDPELYWLPLERGTSAPLQA